MDTNELAHVIEAILFVAGEAVPVKELARALQTGEKEVREAIDSLKDEYDVYYIGGVTGYNAGRMNNCHNSGLVTVNEQVEPDNIENYYYIDKVGGVAGYNDNGNMNNCHNSGSVTVNVHEKYSGEDYYYIEEIGGVVGENYSSDGIITNCYNTGEVYVSGVDPEDVGGFVGENEYSEGTITNCYNTGSISGSGDYARVGGVAGFNDYKGTPYTTDSDKIICVLKK